MIYTFKKIKHKEGSMYLVPTDTGDVEVEITEELQKNLIGLDAITEELDSFESYIIRGVETFKNKKKVKNHGE